MKTYIALLRGINVSGQKKIKMAELRAHLSGLGYSDLSTYIQSGNIVFRAEKNPNDVFESQIHRKIKEMYGWEVPVTVISLAEMETVIREVPYEPEYLAEGNKFYVTFLERIPEPSAVEALQEYATGEDSFKWIGKRIYIHLPQGAARTKLNNNTIERKLGMKGTTRNWKTVLTLAEMGQKIDQA